ncbi:Trypsin-like serine protease, partial [Euroglyphus maynei]
MFVPRKMLKMSQNLVQSHWYIAGYSSYQHGCDPLTGHPIFRGYSPHPTLFSNLFSMKPFIDQTLGLGTYRHKRTKLNEISHHNDIDQRLGVNEEKRAVFIVTGSLEDQQWLMEQDARKQKSINMNNATTNNEDGNTTLAINLDETSSLQNSTDHSNVSKIETLTIANNESIISSNDTENQMTTLIPSNEDKSNFTNEKDLLMTDDPLFLLNNSTEINRTATEPLSLSNTDYFIENITTTTTQKTTSSEITSIDDDYITNKTMSTIDDSTAIIPEKPLDDQLKNNTENTFSM